MQGLSGWVILAGNLLVVMAVLVRGRADGARIGDAAADAGDDREPVSRRPASTPAAASCAVTSKQAAAPVKQLVLSLAAELPNPGRLAPVIVDRADALGAGRALEFRADDGSSQTVWLYPDQPFVFSRLSLVNKTSEPKKFSTIVPLSFSVESSLSPSDLKWFGSDGPGAAGDEKTSYVFISLVDPKTRSGIVGGWITHERASGVVAGGIVAGKSSGDSLSIDARSEYGKLIIAPGANADGETFALGFFDDARFGLEAFADATARVNKIKLPPAYNGYSTWYHAHALDEKRMAELAQFAKEHHLADYGLNFLQIDDQWQVGRRDFTTHKTG
jgi:hypothetical protein